MNLSAEIVVNKDIHNLKELFAAEEKNFKNQRAGYEVVKQNDKIVFKVKAKDSSALRAVLNSITKMISVYEKTSEVVKNER